MDKTSWYNIQNEVIRNRLAIQP